MSSNFTLDENKVITIRTNSFYYHVDLYEPNYAYTASDSASRTQGTDHVQAG